MDRDEMKAKRDRLIRLFERYSAGDLASIDEDEFGELKRDTTQETIAAIKARIADLDRRMRDPL